VSVVKTISLVALLAFPGVEARSQTNSPAADGQPPPESAVQEKPADRLWSFAFGVGVISDNTLADYLEPSFDKLQGPGGGLTYNFTVARQLHQFDWRVGKIHLRPRLELPVMLTFVDENRGRFIPDLNVGVVLRWQDWPWNRFVRTTLSAGPGLSYAYHVWEAEAQRHPGEDRSQFKFWLPIEFTVALPRYPHHQFLLFIDHQSGGTLFDQGGVDAWGLGFRYEF
jgi:hypothetical protein